jgi:hypothetical protein
MLSRISPAVKHVFPGSNGRTGACDDGRGPRQGTDGTKRVNSPAMQKQVLILTAIRIEADAIARQ